MTPTPTQEPITNVLAPGVQVFLWGSPNTERDLKLVKEAGFVFVKQSFEWRYIEPHEKGKFDWPEPDRVVDAVNKAGLKLIARVDNQPKWSRKDGIFPTVAPPDELSDYADFLSAMARRYKGRIYAYQIWNEPNLAREWGDKPPSPKEYVEMLKVAHRAIKDADPDALVLTAGLAPTTASGGVAMPDVEFVKQMYANGAKGSFDMLGAHGAGYKAPPELSPDEIGKDPRYNHGEQGAGRIYGFRHVEDIRKIMVEAGDGDRKIAILEFGWTTDNRPNSPYAWHAVTEEEQADYLVRAFTYARDNWRPWIGLMSAIYIAAPHWKPEDEQYHWSITRPDGSIRPAYTRLKGLLRR